MDQKLIKGGQTSHFTLHTSQKGITLIALVITIIVLLILAGVTISMVLGDDGIISQAQSAQALNKDAAIEEEIEIIKGEVKLAKYGAEPINQLPTNEEEVIARLVLKGIVNGGELIPAGYKQIGYAEEGKTKTFSLEGIMTWDNSQAGDFTIANGVITAYTGTGGNVVIPDTATSIGANVFNFNENITSITIPNSITSIGEGAFADCSLTEIIIPDSVTSIGSEAFAHSSSRLECITIPSSVTNLGSDIFSNNQSLTSVVIENGVTTIPNAMFYMCSNLSSITIPNTITSIGNNAFDGCGISSITIPNNVTSIGDQAFSGTGISSITIPGTVESIGSSAFLGCHYLGSITIENGVKRIGDSVFGGCDSLTSVTFPESLESLGSYTFMMSNATPVITFKGKETTIGSDLVDSYMLSATTIRGYNPSTAKSYAEANGYTFVEITE